MSPCHATRHVVATAAGAAQEAEVGARAHAVVTGIKDYGVFLRFYGDLKALAPLRELSLGTEQDPAKVYSLGQIVKARIIQADPATRRLLASLRVGGTASLDTAGVPAAGSVGGEGGESTPQAGGGAAVRQEPEPGDGGPGGAVPQDPLRGLQAGDVVEGTLRAVVQPAHGKVRADRLLRSCLMCDGASLWASS